MSLRHSLLRLLRTSPYGVLDRLYFQKRHSRKMQARNERIIGPYLSTAAEPRLQIGCGKNAAAGWLNTDLVPQGDQVAMLDVGTRFPFADSTFHYIYSEHILEHLTFGQSVNMLSESLRVLRPGGTMRLAIPHMEFLLGLYLKPNEPLHQDYIKWAAAEFCKEEMGTLGPTGRMTVYVINNFYRNWGHQVLHDTSSISALLERVGFVKVARQEVGISKHPVLSAMERHGNIIPMAFNKLETMVLEAQKPG